ncbi:two-component system response regulator [Candidatus Endobugula sertula]|uniref:Two-component system response regulator n=1 Tax=Candidatus Endobugula sertula TaxID=62101 RepID=A0A1D2QMI5_9GAMM|nr:two-component system response regulator [Candidatus Endobugula sertula]
METKTLNILFVEDSEDDVELTLSELERAGYKVYAHRIETSELMQQALVDHQWDVIISDYKMPRFSAEKSLAVYNQKNLDIPFIIVSGVVEAEDVVYLLKQGAHDFLNKNFLARLVPAIERELRDSKVRSAQRRAEQKVSILSLAVEQSPVSVVITDPDGVIEYVNPKFESSTGYCLEEAMGMHLGFTIMQDAGEVNLGDLWHSIREKGDWNGEFCNLHKNGMLFWEYVNISPLEDENGNIIHFVSVQEDITARRSYEEQLRIQAHFDDLTGLANRTLMIEKLNHAIEYSYQNDISMALLCIDLDHFKNINDSLGHMVGDELLRQAASRLASCTKKSDTLARMGGDEFVIILPRIEENNVIQRVADRILQQFSKPFVIDHHDHFITASIGVAKYPENSKDPHVLLRNADLAMYQAKKLGRNQCQFFSEDINNLLNERMAIENALRGVELRNELTLLYQPIIEKFTHRIIACEVLLRWCTHDGYCIMPDKFIPIAEECGLIKNVGEWVVKNACEDLHLIHRTLAPSLKFAINISPRQLQLADFAHFLGEQLDEYQIQAEMIDLEITESVLINDQVETRRNLEILCEMGFNLSIDDFGTGYSSLGYLQKYPFKKLKIDRSFISQIEDNTSNSKLTETMITMSHSLGMQVVAEGLETSEQLEFLQQRHCDLMQGYFFSKPIPLSELKTLLKKGNHSNVVKFIR